jgi:hypothetical protein
MMGVTKRRPSTGALPHKRADNQPFNPHRPGMLHMDIIAVQSLYILLFIYIIVHRTGMESMTISFSPAGARRNEIVNRITDIFEIKSLLSEK